MGKITLVWLRPPFLDGLVTPLLEACIVNIRCGSAMTWGVTEKRIHGSIARGWNSRDSVRVSRDTLLRVG